MFKVVITGKVNVGKSTLFNRLIEEKKSIVSDEPGTTRDRIHGLCSWRGKSFELIDMAGLKKQKGEIDLLEKEIQKQIELAIEEADLILFLLDVKKVISADDREMAQRLRKLKKPLVFVLNKVDSPREREIIERENFLKLGLGKPLAVSAANGSGLGDLLDEIINHIKETSQPKEEAVKVAIIGKTNVGKSTLFNAILGEERVIVSPFPHTTREPVDTFLEYKGRPMILIDTVGLRKKTKIKKEIEKVGLEKSLKVIKKAEVILFVVDLTEKTTHLERSLTRMIKEEKRSIVLVVNKFDLARTKMEKYLDAYEKEFTSLWWVPIVFVSAKEKINLDKVLDLVFEIKEKAAKLFSQQEMDKLLENFVRENKFKQKFWLKAKLTQKKDKIPNFLLTIPKLSRKEIPPRPAQFNLLEKKIREKFSLWGVSVSINAKF